MPPMWYHSSRKRYRVTIHGVHPADINKDDAKVAEFIFFSELGEQLIGCPVQPLVESTKNNDDLIPPPITRLYGKQYSLKVSVTRRALQMPQISYQVESMSALLPVTASTSADEQIQQKGHGASANFTLSSMPDETHASGSVHLGHEPFTTPKKIETRSTMPDYSTPSTLQLSPPLRTVLSQPSSLASKEPADVPSIDSSGNPPKKATTKRKLFDDNVDKQL